MTSAPWTIEEIRDALPVPALAQRFLSDILRTPADELPGTCARWRHIAQRTQAALERADEVLAYEARGQEPPGDWIDGASRLQRIREQGAA